MKLDRDLNTNHNSSLFISPFFLSNDKLDVFTIQIIYESWNVVAGPTSTYQLEITRFGC